MLAVAVALALALSPVPEAQEPPFTQDGVSPIDENAPRGETVVREDSELAVAATPKKLDLGAYVLFAPPPKPSPKIGPHFDTSIEVVASAPRDPNEAMAEWWRHWNFETSIYGRGINVQKPMPGGGFNILPLIEWLGKKAKERRENREPE
jgi:hypothetical protein